jgi:hypothetical protein
MDYDTFAQFRRGLYACFRRAGDALMNTNDALLCDTTARSFVELSLSPFFVRRWPSLYEGLQDAVIDRAALQTLFAAQVQAPAPGQRLVLGVDASSIARPQSPTARDRTYVHAANLPEGSKPVTSGWQYSTLSLPPSLCCPRRPAVGPMSSTTSVSRASRPRGRSLPSNWRASCRICLPPAYRRCVRSC